MVRQVKRIICLFRKHKYSSGPLDRLYIGKLHPESGFRFPPHKPVHHGILGEYVLEGDIFEICERCGHKAHYGYFLHIGDQRAQGIPKDIAQGMGNIE